MLREDNIAQMYQRFKSKYHKRLNSKEKITIHLNESPVSLFHSKNSREHTRLHSQLLLNSSATRSKNENLHSYRPTDFMKENQKISQRKGFDDILDNYFSGLPSTRDAQTSRPTNEKSARSRSRSQKRLQDAMEALKSEFSFPSSVRKADTIELLHRSRRTVNNTPKRPLLEYNLAGGAQQSRTPQSIQGDKGLLKEELMKLLMHVERMSSKEFEELPASYKKNMNKLAQAIQSKQKGSL
eukprot:TRINITY_DN9835_c0_g1_i2.p1 TRINITY_DN9835_c0_g1~~TRINITY_DN9835_c0_g1_i2.p1  ORF type:complete len:240 (-),score=42.64 TRINITY_DN9835_c0_g1_i2:55-774(-)